MDTAMMDGYTNGDPYLDFAGRAALPPTIATEASHCYVRNICKTLVLGAHFGIREQALASRIGTFPSRGKQLLRTHDEAYSQYWRWLQDANNFAGLHGYIDSVFGWRFHINGDTRPTTVTNFPMQANGAEM